MTNGWIIGATLAGPAAHLLASWFAERTTSVVRQLLVSRVVAALALASCSLAAAAVFGRQEPISLAVTRGGLGVEVLLDRLSVTFALVNGVLGFVVLDYSRKYLAGDPAHASFMGRLHLTLGLATLLSYSGNLVQLVTLWCLTSFALHRLLFFYRSRSKVVRSAARKFRMARAGDVMLATAAALLYGQFGTGSIVDIAHQASRLIGSSQVGALAIAGLLLVGAASLKSGQVPNHVWLPDVVEAPTPVSALLHAGIVNGGGFLMLRFANVVDVTWLPATALLVIGGVSAVWGSLVMLTKPTVKEALAYSTVGQMGLMMFECAIGAYELAMLHIVAHSAYKAHAFLSAGELNVNAVVARSDSPVAFLSRWGCALGVLAVGQAMVLGTEHHIDASGWVLLTIVASAIALASSTKVFDLPAGLRASLAGLAASGLVIAGLGSSYLFVEYAAHRVWGQVVAAERPLQLSHAWVSGIFSAVFAGIAFAQSVGLRSLDSRLLRRAYVYVKGDVHARLWFERAWGARIGSRRSERQSVPVGVKSVYQQL